MKTIVLCLFLTVLSLGLVAQNDKLNSELNEVDFFNQKIKDSIITFDISPKFKTDKSLINFKLSPQFQVDLANKKNSDSIPVIANNQIPEFRMPVVGGAYQIKMPVVVPDSSVHYYILEKRIQYYNPLERNHK